MSFQKPGLLDALKRRALFGLWEMPLSNTCAILSRLDLYWAPGICVISVIAYIYCINIFMIRVQWLLFFHKINCLVHFLASFFLLPSYIDVYVVCVCLSVCLYC